MSWRAQLSAHLGDDPKNGIRDGDSVRLGLQLAQLVEGQRRAFRGSMRLKRKRVLLRRADAGHVSSLKHVQEAKVLLDVSR